VTDETPKPASGEPEPGSTDWLLAQLSGGRIDSRRERREAEARLEAAGVPLPDAPAEPPADELPPSQPNEADGDEVAAGEAPARETPADEKPRARFSWQTGTLEAVDAPASAAPTFPPLGTPDVAETPSPLMADSTADTLAVPPVPSVPVEPEAPSAEPEPAITFMWNLTPTEEPDPALSESAAFPEPDQAAPEQPYVSSAPLVVPKPLAAEPPVAPAAEPSLPEPSAPTAAPGDEPAESAEPATPAAQAAPAAEPEPEPTRAEDTPSAPAATGPSPLPPGTTAHEFDPFAADPFAPRAAAVHTPVPPVDEFTIPDEGSQAPASVPGNAQAEQDAHGSDDVDEPADPEVSSDWGDIADMLGAHPETVDTAIVSPMPPAREILPSFDAILPRAQAPAPAGAPAPATPVPAASAPARPATAPLEHSRAGGGLNRWLLIAAAVLLAILIAVALFTLGRSVAAGRDQAPVAATHTTTPSPTPSAATATPTPTATDDDETVAGTGPLPPGQSYRWDQLRGGECVDPFTSAWAQHFDVVDCNAQHAAQLVYQAPFTTDPSAVFPGEQAIASQINTLCGKPGVVDLQAASAYNDVQLVAAYPVNAQQWNTGQRDYYCFATRASGQPLTSSIAGPGPTE
jgi:hypothetical protein